MSMFWQDACGTALGLWWQHPCPSSHVWIPSIRLLPSIPARLLFHLSGAQVCGRITGMHSLGDSTWQRDNGCRDPGKNEPHSPPLGTLRGTHLCPQSGLGSLWL